MNRIMIAAYAGLAVLLVIIAFWFLFRELRSADLTSGSDVAAGQPAAAVAEPGVKLANRSETSLNTKDIYASLRRRPTRRVSGVERGGVGADRERGAAASRIIAAAPDEVSRLRDRIRVSRDEDEKIALLMELDGRGGQAVLDLFYEMLDESSSDIKLSILSLLQDMAGEKVLPHLEKGLRDSDPEVRQGCLLVLDSVEEPGVSANLLKLGAEDSDENVRETAFDILYDKMPEERHQVLAETINSDKHDVRVKSVQMLSDTPSYKSMEILLLGLKDNDPEVRDEVNWTLDYFVSEEFDSYDDAVRWWNANKHRFDEELFEK